MTDRAITAARAARGKPGLHYRPGLDGLRALAVAAVFVYHARGGWLPGGFLGVDVFFVLSGYLITSLLLVEWERARQLDLVRFWGRRARRLLPAVVVVILAALAAAAIFGHDVLGRTRGDAVASLLYVTNWHLVLGSHSYFDAFGRPSPLQHLWSLAVEEQFYLVWPVALVAGLALLGRRATAALTIAAAAGSAVLMWTLYDPHRDPSRVYFGTDTRAATLLVGALLALGWPAARSPARRTSRRAVALLDGIGLAGLVLVALMVVGLHDYEPRVYRGGLVVAAVAAALVVAAAAHPATRVGRALGWSPLRWLGVRSYGIYLWHWPVLVFTRPRVDVPWGGTGLVLAQAAATVALAALSFRFVEEPIRRGVAWQWLVATLRRQRVVSLAGAAATLGVVLTLLLGWTMPPSHPPAQALAPPAPAPAAKPKPQPKPPARRPRAPRPVAATPKPQLGRILAVGDSVMLACRPDLERRLGRRLRIDAVVGRQAIDTIQALADYGTRGALPEIVVVQVGDNGPVWYADLVRLRRVLARVPQVVLVNVRVERSWQDQVNKALADFAPEWRRAAVADWHRESSGTLLRDGVHPTGDGCAAYVSTIARTLRAA